MLVRRPLTALAALVLVSTAACGSDGEEGSGGSGGAAGGDALDGLTVTGEFGEKPKISMDGLDVDKAEATELIEGDGAEVTRDSHVDYWFTVVNKDGDEVAGNYQENAPTQLVVAEQPESIIDAVVGSHIGSRIAIAIPVKDLVGEQGAPEAGLEPGDDMVLVFDMVEEQVAPLDGPEGKAVDPPADAPKVLGGEDGVSGFDFSDAPAKAPKKLQIIPLIEGEGPAVKQGDNITVDYFGAVWGNEKQPFDESYSRTPASFPLEPGGLIEGWVQGLEGVTVGSRVMLVIPPELGYGAQGKGEEIPGNSTLVFVIDVLGV